MRCPYCKADDDRVIDSRASADGFAIRRRRACRECNRRYTTYERVESAPLRVVKKSGERVEFDRAKIMGGLTRAAEKRPVSVVQLEQLCDRVERQVVEAFDREVPSKVIGELIMEELKDLDHVAYVRFASVYREFKDVGQFLEALRPMLDGAQPNGSSAAPAAAPTDRLPADGPENVQGGTLDDDEPERRRAGDTPARERHGEAAD